MPTGLTWAVLLASLAANVSVLWGYFHWREPLRFGIVLAVPLVVLAVGICLLVAAPRNLQTPLTALLVGVLATLGWLVTNYLNRYQDKLKYTYTVIDHFRSNEALQRDVLFLHKTNPKQSTFTPPEVEQHMALLRQAESYDHTQNPPLYPFAYAAIRLVNFIEQAAFLYRNEYIDQRMFYRNFNLLFGRIIVVLQEFVRSRRVGSAKAYNDLHWLVMLWYDVDIDQQELTTDIVRTRKLPEFAEDYSGSRPRGRRFAWFS